MIIQVCSFGQSNTGEKSYIYLSILRYDLWFHLQMK